MARVLFFYPSDFLGPVMTVYSQIARHLDRFDIEPYVAINAGAAGELPIRPGEAVVTSWPFGAGLGAGSIRVRLRSALKLARSMGSLVRYAKREGVRIVQCTPTAYAGTLGLMLSTAVGIPMVAHVHELVGRYAGGRKHTWMRRALERLVLSRASQVVAVSEFIAEDLIHRGVPAKKVSVIRNGVDLERFRPDVDGATMREEYGVGEGEVLALQLGRILESKRQEDFARALGAAVARAPRLRGLIVGWEDSRYPSAARIREIARTSGLADRLIIGAARPEAPQLIAAADIVVAPSLDEAFPLVVLEAMAAGKPVVGVCSGSIPEQIVDGETGFLVAPRCPEALSESLVTLARDPVLRERMGASGRRRAEEEFAEGRVADEFAALYATVVGGHS